MRFCTTILLFVFASLLILGCGRQLYMPTSKDETEQADLLQGRKLYVNHCGGCHNLHLPKEYSDEQWQKNVDEMQEKAKISDGEKKLILQFLTFRH